MSNTTLLKTYLTNDKLKYLGVLIDQNLDFDSIANEKFKNAESCTKSTKIYCTKNDRLTIPVTYDLSMSNSKKLLLVITRKLLILN